MPTKTKSFANALPPGTRLHWYEFLSVIGQGAFGITYLANDTNLNRQVAIKEYLPGQLATRGSAGAVEPLSSELADDYAVGLQRFIVEARTLARFEHPNIVRVHNVFEANDTAYMVMQYEEGRSLSQILKHHGPLDEDRVRALVYPLLSGLEAIHATGFIHRDIKPANIFIRQSGVPVLLDFGSARQSLENQTRTLTNFVSPGYAPIEQYTGKSDSQGPWTDIYGLGATLYRAITGEAPVNAIERGEALAHETADTYQPMTDRVAENFRPALMSVIDHALRFRSQDRPGSIAQWRTEFDAAFGLQDPGATAPTEPLVTTARVRSTVRPHVIPASGPARNYAVAATVGGLALIAGVALVRFGGPEEQGSPAAVIVASPSVTQPLPETPEMPEAGSVAVDGKAGSAPAGADVTEPVPAAKPVSPAEALLAAAGSDLAALRLTTPKGNNAYEKYRQVITLDPGNQAAARGIEAISDRYLQLAYRDIDAGEIERATRYVDKAEALAPGRNAIAEARAALVANAEANADGAAQSYAGKIKALGKRFGDFVEEQQPETQSRGDEFLRRFGN